MARGARQPEVEAGAGPSALRRREEALGEDAVGDGGEDQYGNHLHPLGWRVRSPEGADLRGGAWREQPAGQYAYV